MKWLPGYAAAVCILILAVCTSISIPTFLLPFYSHEYDKYQIPESIGVQKDDLMAVTRHLLDYMRGKQPDLVVTTAVHGEQREFFNQREKDHMVDVLNLFDIGFKVRNTTFWTLLLLLLIMIFFKIDIPFVLARCCREVVTGFAILAGILTIVIVIDFDRAFNVFHYLFFQNDLWQLNPDTDLLVNIVPFGFFMDISMFIGIILAVFSIGTIVLSTLYIRSVRRPEH